MVNIFRVMFEGFPSKYMYFCLLLHLLSVKAEVFFNVILFSFTFTQQPCPRQLAGYIFTRQREGRLRESLGLFQFIPCRYGLFNYNLWGRGGRSAYEFREALFRYVANQGNGKRPLFSGAIRLLAN
jgi:hypothetical protein